MKLSLFSDSDTTRSRSVSLMTGHLISEHNESTFDGAKHKKRAAFTAPGNVTILDSSYSLKRSISSLGLIAMTLLFLKSFRFRVMIKSAFIRLAQTLCKASS